MKNKSANTFFTLLLSLSFLLIVQNTAHAQEHDVYEVSYNNLKKETSKKNDRERFYDLAFKKQPTHYFNNNGFKSNSGTIKPLKINLGDTKSFNKILDSSYEKEYVELLVISLDNQTELYNSLDISNSTDFKKLKYVYVKCKYNCSNEDILKFVKVNSNVRVFYKYDLPQ
jgi:hypothetical protein